MLALDIHDLHLRLQNYLKPQQPRAGINHRPTQTKLHMAERPILASLYPSLKGLSYTLL